ncbi:MAG: NUDIX domain-containing protein [Thermoleophilia bacterium]
MRVSGLVLDHDCLLLVRQTHVSREHWLLPGGAVERGETLAEALEREISEECRLRVRVENGPVALVQTISPDGGKTRHLIQLIFEARTAVPGTGTATPTSAPHFEPGDPAIKELRWFAAHEIEKLDIHPPIHDLLISWLRFRKTNPTAPMPFVFTGPLWAKD